MGVKRQWLPSQGLTISRYPLISMSSSVRMRGNCTPVVFQLSEYLRISSGTQPRPYRDNQIETRQHYLMVAKTLPDQALDAVTSDCVASCLDGYGRPQPGMIQFIGHCQHR